MFPLLHRLFQGTFLDTNVNLVWDKHGSFRTSLSWSLPDNVEETHDGSSSTFFKLANLHLSQWSPAIEMLPTYGWIIKIFLLSEKHPHTCFLTLGKLMLIRKTEWKFLEHSSVSQIIKLWESQIIKLENFRSDNPYYIPILLFSLSET